MPLQTEAYRRRWASRYCVLSISMLHLVAMLIIIQILTLRPSQDAADKRRQALHLVALLPFIGHSYQLLRGWCLINAVYPNPAQPPPAHLLRCNSWCLASKFLGPTIILEVFVLRSWEFDYLLTALIVGPYLVSIFKVHGLLSRLITSVLATRSGPNTITDLSSFLQESEVPEILPSPSCEEYSSRSPDYLPGYEEAMKAQFQPKTAEENCPKYDQLPPHYSDIIICQSQI